MEPFVWPDGRRAAISLSFDDTRPSQLDHGLPILDRHGVKATFYATPRSMEARLSDWQRAAASGHEIGNHTVSHPCSGNFAFSRHNALEDYTPERLADELDQASQILEGWTGVAPTTFAYPCGQKFIGRGVGVQSYVALVAQRFVIGRGFRDEAPNDPRVFDPAQTSGVDFDGLTLAQCLAWIEKAIATGGWLVLAGHDVGEAAHQTVPADTLDALCRHCQDPENGLWIDTVAAVGAYIAGTSR